VGLTALGVLSLLAQGSTPTEGKYSEPLKKGLAYLLSAARDDGAILDARGPNHLGKPVKNWYVDLQTGLGVIALAECYGKVKDKKTRETIQGKVEAAIRYLQKIQLKTGGWDYRESSDGGPYGITHVTVSDTYTVLAAFLAARDAGFTVETKALDRAVASLLACANKDGSFAYTDNGQINRAVHRRIPPLRYFRTGACLYVLTWAGKEKNPAVRNAKAFLEKHRAEILQYGNAAGDVHTSYAFLFAALGMHRLAPKEGKAWLSAARQFLPPANQNEDGSWEHTGKTEPGRRVGGDLKNQRKGYATAIATLILQVPLGELKVLVGNGKD
jgi:hypothetical protein